MSSAVQHSFGGGEIAPVLYSRVDNTKYASGLKTNRNGIITKSGAWMNRSGSLFCHEVLDSTKEYRLIPYIYNLEQAFMILFGHQTIQFLSNGNPILENGIQVTGMTTANPGVFTATQTYANGDQVYITYMAAGPGAFLNNRYFLIANVTGTTFTLQYMDGQNVDTTALAGTGSIGATATVQRVYTMNLPSNYYQSVDLANLKFDQSGDLMTLTHPNYAPAQLQFTETVIDGVNQWIFSTLQLVPGQPPLAKTITATATGAWLAAMQYMVTTVNGQTGEESFPGVTPPPYSGGAGGITNYTWGVTGYSYGSFSTTLTLTIAGSTNLSNGTPVNFNGFTSNSGNPLFFLNGKTYAISNLVGNTFNITINTSDNVYIFLNNGNPRSVSGGSAYYSYQSGGGTLFTNITAVSNANPCVVTINNNPTSYNWATGGIVYLDGTGVSQLDKRVFQVTVLTPNTFALNGVDATNYDIYNPATIGSVWSCEAGAQGNLPSLTTPVVLTWNNPILQPSGQSFYFNIYRKVNGVYGYIGQSYSSTFTDFGTPPDDSQEPPSYDPILNSVNNFPSNCAYYQQRHCFSASNKQPGSFWSSRTGYYNNFTESAPVQDSDAVNFEIPSTKASIQNMLDIGNLILFTESDERVIQGNNQGGQYGALTPTAINEVVQSWWGSANIRPIAINGSAVFVQSRGNMIRDLKYDFNEDKYKGNDLTVFASHLFETYAITDMDYQKMPNSVLWCVRNDGTLLSATINREQEILAWGWHDTQGSYENVACIPELAADSVYLVVARQISDENGNVVIRKYVERFQERTIAVPSPAESIYMDCAGTYNGNGNVNGIGFGSTFTLTGGINWTNTELLLLTADGDNIIFALGQVGQKIILTGNDGLTVACTILAFTSGFSATVQTDITVPASCRSTVITTWAYATNVIYGLWQINGNMASVSGDGYVVASPNNSQYTQIGVRNGSITLPGFYTIVNVGIPYKSDLKTLDIDVVGYSVFMGQTATDKWKNISEVTPNLVNSSGGFYGSANPDTETANSSNDPLFKLYEIKPMNGNSSTSLPPPLITDNIRLNIQGGWDIHGNVFVRQVDPLPLCISSLTFSGNLPLRTSETQGQSRMAT